MDLAVIEKDRESWDEVDYAGVIKGILTGSVKQAAVLLLEAKKRFFLSKEKHWANYVKENIRISRQSAYELERIAVRLIPRMDDELFDAYGKCQLSEISKVEDDDNLSTVLTIVNPNMKLKELKEKIAPFIEKKQGQKKFKSGKAIADQIINLNEVITELFPEEDDSDVELERKRKRASDLRIHGFGAWESARNALDFVMDENSFDLSDKGDK